jgi:hypothetical protein
MRGYTVEQKVVQRIASFGTKAQLEPLTELKSLFEGTVELCVAQAGGECTDRSRIFYAIILLTIQLVN